MKFKHSLWPHNELKKLVKIAALIYYLCKKYTRINKNTHTHKYTHTYQRVQTHIHIRAQVQRIHRALLVHCEIQKKN